VRFRFATFARLTIGIIVGILVFVGIAYVRIGGPSAHGSQKIASKVEAYAFGYLPAFSVWQNSLETPSSNFAYRGMRWGDLTFNGVTKFIVNNPIDNDPYPEFVTVNKEGADTNIYTFFRGLIQDFGMIGAVIFMLGAGFVASRSYEVMLRYRTIGSFLATTAITSFVLFTVICSLFSFTNICAAFLADAIIMRSFITTHMTAVSGRSPKKG
jgi:oligosaccharide repeat unit polymerase